MLWKHFQNGMYSFRENWEINFTICHTVPRFTPQLSTISLKSNALFQCHSEITWLTVNHSLTWFPFVWYGKVNRTDSSTKDFSLIGSFFFYICWNSPVSKYSTKTTNFLFLNLFLHFLYPLVLKHLRIFITVMQSISLPLS